LRVLVKAMGYSRNPDSATQASPVISPVPLRTNAPAGTFFRHTSSRGTTTVTPVRTGPSPGFKGPSPLDRVVCPTFTPATSVMAFKGPGGNCPNVSPTSRARTRLSVDSSEPSRLQAGDASRAQRAPARERRNLCGRNLSKFPLLMSWNVALTYGSQHPRRSRIRLRWGALYWEWAAGSMDERD
jgi:hypothetical protein